MKALPAPPRFTTALDAAHADAAKEAGSEDFGPDDYRPGLEVLLQSMDYDPHFSPAGRDMAWASVVGALAARARAHAAMAANPGFEETPVRAPVVITGIPRSGTTALHRLLAVDPRFQGLQTWLLDSPMPRPPRSEWDTHPRFLQVMEDIAARHRAAPGRAAAHQSVAEGLEEDCILLRHSFTSNIWNCAGWSSATYDAWWQTQDEAAAYRYLARCIRLIGSNDTQRRWLLKNPGHVHHLDQVFALFPDAKVIQTHRDPAKAIPSLCSLLIKLHPLFEDGRLEQHAEIMGTREAEKWAAGIRATQAARREQEERGRKDGVLDIVHGDFHRDPMGVMERIYAFLDMELTDEIRPLLARRISEKPELQHGPHRYTLAEFGLEADRVRAIFGDYVQRYDMTEAAR